MPELVSCFYLQLKAKMCHTINFVNPWWRCNLRRALARQVARDLCAHQLHSQDMATHQNYQKTMLKILIRGKYGLVERTKAEPDFVGTISYEAKFPIYLI
eukprot:SAG11_NODE_1722_length_4374_cov_5.082807_4_plen_100_part_00